MTLRERAQEWLDNYKGAGNAYGGNVLSLEEMAAIIAEYLHESGDSDSYREKYDKCRAELEKALERNANLEQYIGKLADVQKVTVRTLDQCEKELADVKAKLNNSELTRESLVYDLARARSKNEIIKALPSKAELLHGDLIEAQNEAEDLRKRNKELEFQLDGAERRVLRLEGENSAYRFAIRCNGVSGGEVRP